MADQNSSNNRRGMNTFADDIDQSQFLTELERIGSRISRKGIQRSELESRIRSEGKLLNSLLEEGRQNPEYTSSPFYQEKARDLKESIRGLRGRMNGMDEVARNRADSEAATYIARQFNPSTINGQASAMQRDAAVQNRAFTMTGLSYDQLSAQRQDVLADIRVRERNALNETKNLYSGRGQVDPERSAALGVMMSGTADQVRQLAAINAAQAYQRSIGMDPNSRMKNIGEMGKQANQILSAESIAKEIQSGGISISQGGKMSTIANDDVNKELVNQARQLAQALKELSEGAGKTDEELSKLRQTADESADNMKKLQDAQSGGAGGGRNGVNMAMALAGGFSAVGGAAQAILVNQRMQEVSNIGGFANLANQQYDMYKKARGGDIASQLAMSQWGEAANFGSEMRNATNIVQAMNVAAGGAQATAGALQATNAAKNLATTAGYMGSQEFMAGVQNGIQGTATMAVAGSDIAKGASARAAQLAGIQANMQARMAVNAIPAEQMQGLRNFYTDLDVAAQGAGGRADSFLNEATSKTNLNRMSQARISPEQFAKLSAFGMQEMGSTFDSNQIFAARNLESRGFGSMQANMGRMAQLAGAGANNPQEGMEAVLSAAVTKGLDSSKSLDLMVQHTASMVQASGASMAAGINTTGAVSSLIAGVVDPNAKNKEFAIQRAAQAQDVANQITTDTSATFTGMINTARISKATGLSGDNALFAAKLTTADIRSLQGMNEGAAKEALLNKGVDISTFKGGTKEFLQKMLQSQTEQMLTGSGSLAFGTNDQRSGLLSKIKTGTSWDKLADSEKALLGKIGGTSGLTGQEFFNTAAGITTTKIADPKTGSNLTAKPSDEQNLKNDLDKLRTGGFKQLSDAALTAATNLEKFGGALEVFKRLQEDAERDGAQSEQDFSTAAADFAKTMKTSFDKFDVATAAYAKASHAIINSVGLNSNRNPIKPEALSNILNQPKASSGGRTK